MANLTKKLIDSLKPDPDPKKTVLVWDDSLPGFGVRVLPSGKKSFFFFFRDDSGKQHRVSLGLFGVRTLEEAREAARVRLGQVAEGKNPVAMERERKADARRQVTLGQFWERYESDGAERWKDRTLHENKRRWEKIIAPEFKNRSINSIERSEVVALHHSMKDKPFEANRTLALLKAMFNQAIDWGYLKGGNPAARIKPYPEDAREIILNGSQLRAVMDAIDAEEKIGSEYSPTGVKLGEGDERQEGGISPFAAGLFRLLIYSGARVSEIQTAEWSMVEWDKAALRLPDSKTGKKTIWLNAPALLELKRLFELKSQYQWIIEGRRSKKTKIRESHLINSQKPWRRVRNRAAKALAKQMGKDNPGQKKFPEAEALKSLRLHDLRHSFASIGVAAGIPLYTVGKALGHAQQSTTERYAHIIDNPLREAAETIGKEIEVMLAGETAKIILAEKQAPVTSTTDEGTGNG